MPKPSKMSFFQKFIFRFETILEILLSSRFLNAQLAYLLRRINLEIVMDLVKRI